MFAEFTLVDGNELMISTYPGTVVSFYATMAGDTKIVLRTGESYLVKEFVDEVDKRLNFVSDEHIVRAVNVGPDPSSSRIDEMLADPVGYRKRAYEEAREALRREND